MAYPCQNGDNAVHNTVTFVYIFSLISVSWNILHVCLTTLLTPIYYLRNNFFSSLQQK